MRSLNYVQRVSLDFTGTIFPHAICLGDADNDSVIKFTCFLLSASREMSGPKLHLKSHYRLSVAVIVCLILARWIMPSSSAPCSLTSWLLETPVESCWFTRTMIPNPALQEPARAWSVPTPGNLRFRSDLTSCLCDPLCFFVCFFSSWPALQLETSATKER